MYLVISNLSVFGFFIDYGNLKYQASVANIDQHETYPANSKIKEM